MQNTYNPKPSYYNIWIFSISTTQMKCYDQNTMFFITPPGFRTAVDAPGEPIFPIHGVILPQSSQNYQMHTLHK